MNIQYELEEPFYYSWKLVYILGTILVLLILGFLITKYSSFFYKHFIGIFKKASIPSLKKIYLRRLARLRNDINNNKINNRDAYLRLSSIIREFIEKTTGVNVLSMSKEEVKKLKIRELNFLMEDYYPPEFSENKTGDIIASINRTMEVIKRWK